MHESGRSQLNIQNSLDCLELKGTFMELQPSHTFKQIPFRPNLHLINQIITFVFVTARISARGVNFLGREGGAYLKGDVYFVFQISPQTNVVFISSKHEL